MIRVAALIRSGALCRHCTGKRCNDLGTEQEPIEIECSDCNGQGCDLCNHGMVNVSGCPKDFCYPVATATRLVDLFDKGLPPVAGGSLDQSVWFLEAARILRNDEAQIRIDSIGN